MSYQSNIPRPTDFISISQGDILNNFGQINTSWDINHEGFNSGVGTTGKHKFVEMPNQSPDPVGAANEVTLFSAVGTQSVSQLFYKRDAAGASYQLTGIDPSAATNGNSFVAGGVIIKWGQVTTNAGGTANIAWNFPNNIFSAQLTRKKTAPATEQRCSLFFDGTFSKAQGNVVLLNSSAAGFADVVCWFAIGN